MNLDIPNVVVMLGIYVLMRQRLKKARKKKGSETAQNSPMENFPFLQELVTLYISLSNDS